MKDRSKETCGYCRYHVWHDEKLHHVCLLAGGEGGEMSIAGTCDKWKKSRRGYVGCINSDHKNTFADYDVLCGHVKDDKYTRKK